MDNYSQPTADALDRALEVLLDQGGEWDAIVVDEGQDFSPDWWPVLEASLRDWDQGVFYIFFDDAQSLLPYRAQYPLPGPALDLSRNCRNAGAVFDVMRRLAPGSPRPKRHSGRLARRSSSTARPAGRDCAYQFSEPFPGLTRNADFRDAGLY